MKLHCGLLIGGFSLLSPLHAATTLLDDLLVYLNFEQAIPVDVSGSNTKVTHNNIVGNTLQGHYAPVTSLAGNAGFYNRNNQAYSKIATSFGNAAAPANGYALGYEFTISAWYYLQPSNANPTGDKRFFVYESDEDYELSIYVKGYFDGPDAFKVDGVTSTMSSIVAIGPITTYDLDSHLGSWNHVVETFTLSGDKVIKKTYVNGEYKYTVERPVDAFFRSSGINLGTHRDNNNRYWDGFLDEVGIWNRPLTESEIVELYQFNLAGLSLVPEPSKMALFLSSLIAMVMIRRRYGVLAA